MMTSPFALRLRKSSEIRSDIKASYTRLIAVEEALKALEFPSEEVNAAADAEARKEIIIRFCLKKQELNARLQNEKDHQQAYARQLDAAIAKERTEYIDGSDKPDTAEGVNFPRFGTMKSHTLVMISWENDEGEERTAFYPAYWHNDEIAQDSYLEVDEKALTPEQQKTLDTLYANSSTYSERDDRDAERKQMGICD